MRDLDAVLVHRPVDFPRFALRTIHELGSRSSVVYLCKLIGSISVIVFEGSSLYPTKK